MNGDGAAPLARFVAPLPLELRLCREADLPALEWFGAFAHHRGIFAEAFELQRQGLALMLLAVAHDFPVGQAWLDFRRKADAQAPTVWAVRVLDPLRGLGIGERLMQTLETLAHDCGESALEVGVETDNPPARRFYERLGWRLLRERRDAYAYVTPQGQAVTHALHEWVLGKALDQAAGASARRA